MPLHRDQGIMPRATPDLPDHQRDVHEGRTRSPTGRLAVATMLAQEQIEGRTPGLTNRWSVCFNNHPVICARRAGSQ